MTHLARSERGAGDAARPDPRAGRRTAEMLAIGGSLLVHGLLAAVLALLAPLAGDRAAPPPADALAFEVIAAPAASTSARPAPPPRDDGGASGDPAIGAPAPGEPTREPAGVDTPDRATAASATPAARPLAAPSASERSAGPPVAHTSGPIEPPTPRALVASELWPITASDDLGAIAGALAGALAVNPRGLGAGGEAGDGAGGRGGGSGAGRDGRGHGRGAGDRAGSSPDDAARGTARKPRAPRSRARPARLIYPRRHREERPGEVFVALLTVDEDGYVDGARLVQGVSPHQDDKAMSAVWRFRYEPALDRAGRPITSKVRQRFMLE